MKPDHPFRHLALMAVFAGNTALAADTLPLGDGRVSSGERVGHLYACQTRFAGGGGAQTTGPWVRGDRWDPSAKPTVDGEVRWPEASLRVEVVGKQRRIVANSLPAHATGDFPVRSSDDAWRYDRNPNTIRPQRVMLTLPANPQPAARPSCVGMGAIGIALSGAAFFNALDARGMDAPAHEMQDRCNGHPQQRGQYHYHGPSDCLDDTHSQPGGHSDLVGYALDGFGIFGLSGEGGRPVSNADLDGCHGHEHEVVWDGRETRLYHYHLTHEFPYTVGCYRGTPVRSAAGAGGDGTGTPAPGNAAAGVPPPGAPPGGHAAMEQAARELGVSTDDLRRAVGPPPPDFRRAARLLGLDEADIRRAMERARRQ